MNLEITCKSIKDLVGKNGELDITLSDVNPDFIEQLPVKDIMMWADNKELMNEFDYDELVDYLEMKYDVKVLDQSGGV